MGDSRPTSRPTSRPSSAGVRLDPLMGRGWDAWLKASASSLATRIAAQHQGNVRVFLSSPFSGMEGERELFTRRFLPQLRHLCASAGLHFTVLDLRWGITETSSIEAQTLRICLREVERCDVFVGFYGQRYGWHQKSGADSRDSLLDRNFDLIKDEFAWAEEQRETASATALEFHAAMRMASDAERKIPVLFFFRDTAWDERMAGACAAGDRFKYVAESEHARANLEQLKKLTVSHGSCYTCDKYGDPADGASRMFVAVRDLLTQTIACLREMEGVKLDDEDAAHRAFVLSRQRLATENELSLALLDNHFGIGREENAEGSEERPDAKPIAPLVVRAESGMGKSSLMANWVSRLEAENEGRVFYHFVSSAGPSTRPQHILRRLARFLAGVAGVDCDMEGAQDRASFREDRFATLVGTMLTRACERAGKIYVVIDGIDQVENASGMEGMVSWLPFRWQSVRVVLTVAAGTAADAALELRGYETINLRRWDAKQVERYIDTALKPTGKQLTTGQRARILAARQCRVPLFLSLFIDELVSSGTFDTLDAHMESLLSCADPEELFVSIIARLEADFAPAEQATAKGANANETAAVAFNPHAHGAHGGHGVPASHHCAAADERNPVAVVLIALALARMGLSEAELAEMFDFGRGWLAPVLYAMQSHLMLSGGLLQFAHKQIRRAVVRRYLPDHYARLIAADTAVMKGGFAATPTLSPAARMVAEGVVAHFSKALQAGNTSVKRAADELVAGLVSLGEERKAQLRETLLDLRVFSLLRFDDRSVVVQAWAGVGSEEMAAAYAKALEETGPQAAEIYLKEMLAQGFFLASDQSWRTDPHLCNVFACSALYILVGEALTAAGSPERAVAFYEHSVALREKYLGPSSPYLANALKCLAGCISMVSHPQATQRATAVASRALGIAEAYFGADNAEVVTFRCFLAHLKRDLGELKEAEALLESCIKSLEGGAYGLSRSDLVLHPAGMEVARALMFVLGAQCRVAEAKALAESLLATIERVFGFDSLHLIHPLHAIGTLLAAANDHEGALLVAERLLAVASRVPGHPTIAHGRRLLAFVHNCQRNFDLAVENYTIALEILRNVYGDDHADVIACTLEIANCLMNAGRLGDAEPHVRRAVEVAERIFGADHIKYAITRRSLGEWLLRSQRLKEAETVFTEVGERVKAAYGPNHPFAAGILSQAAMARVAAAKTTGKGLVEDARASYESAAQTMGPTSKEALVGLVALAEAHIRSGENGRGLELLREALATCEKLHGSTETAWMLGRIGFVCVANGDGVAAVAAVERLETLQAAFATPVWTPMQVASLMCAALMLCRRPADVEAVAARSMSGIQDPASLGQPAATVSLLRATALVELGRYEDALDACDACEMPDGYKSDNEDYAASLAVVAAWALSKLRFHEAATNAGAYAVAQAESLALHARWSADMAMGLSLVRMAIDYGTSTEQPLRWKCTRTFAEAKPTAELALARQSAGNLAFLSTRHFRTVVRGVPLQSQKQLGRAHLALAYAALSYAEREEAPDSADSGLKNGVAAFKRAVKCVCETDRLRDDGSMAPHDVLVVTRACALALSRLCARSGRSFCAAVIEAYGASKEGARDLSSCPLIGSAFGATDGACPCASASRVLVRAAAASASALYGASSALAAECERDIAAVDAATASHLE